MTKYTAKSKQGVHQNCSVVVFCRLLNFIRLCTETLDIGRNSKKNQKQNQDNFKIPPIAADPPIPPDVPVCN